MNDIILCQTNQITIDDTIVNFITKYPTSFYSFSDFFNDEIIKEKSQDFLLQKMSEIIFNDFPKYIGENFIQGKEGLFYKIKYQENFAGFIFLEKVEEPDLVTYPSGFQYELSIGVFDDYQGKGIVESAIKEAISLWKKEVGENEILSALVKKYNPNRNSIIKRLKNTGFIEQANKDGELFFILATP